MSSTSLSVTLAHAISFLTSCLHSVIAPCKITKLQLLLEANLTAHYAATWDHSEPLRGSGRRCLTLGPANLPPRVIYAACIAAGVQWCDWIKALGGKEFDFFVDPGCVSVRVGTRLVTIWADEVPSPAPASTVFKAQGKTLAQQMMMTDEDDERMFAMISHETTPSTWMSAMLDQFPYPRSSSPLSTCSNLSVSSTHSRSSSRSSNSSFSVSSFDSYGSSATTLSSVRADSPKASRRERARQAQVFIDSSKTDVTSYEGGRTTVLTGGVMLGGGSSSKSRKPSPTSFHASSMDWRSVRA